MYKNAQGNTPMPSNPVLRTLIRDNWGTDCNMGNGIVQEVISSEKNVNVMISFKEQHVLISS